MIERARAEADGIVAKAEADAAALVERRTRMAEDKIAAAERAALDEVRAKAAQAATAAAETPDPRQGRRRGRQGHGRRDDRGIGRRRPLALCRSWLGALALPPGPVQRPLQPLVRHVGEAHHGRAAAPPGAGRRAERLRLRLHRQLLLLGQQHHRAGALRRRMQSVAKILPPTRKSGWPICARSSAPGKERAIRRKSSALAMARGLSRWRRRAECLNPLRDRKARRPQTASTRRRRPTPSAARTRPISRRGWRRSGRW